VTALFEPPAEHTYCENMDKVIKWMSDLVSQRSDVQLLRLIRAMVKEKPKERPHANQVWEELVIIYGDDQEARFCGACCMPLDPHLVRSVDSVPHPLVYRPLNFGDKKVAKSATNSSLFETQYDLDKVSPYSRDRYLRIENISTFDSVRDANDHGPDKRNLCRKSFYIHQTTEGTGDTNDVRSDVLRLAQTEAKMLKSLKHRHIVTFQGTYRDGGDVFAILTKPVTSFDLREYLSRIELLPKKSDWKNWRKLLRESPGCLAGAVSFLHENGIAHGDISPENIIVEPTQTSGQIYLANFGRAALKKRMKEYSMLVYGGPRSNYLVSHCHPNRSDTY
jgi:serine/threonine protein kinase